MQMVQIDDLVLLLRKFDEIDLDHSGVLDAADFELARRTVARGKTVASPRSEFQASGVQGQNLGTVSMVGQILGWFLNRFQVEF